MEALVVGRAEPAEALASALRERGLAAELHAAQRVPEGRGVGALASTLVELERRMAGERPGLAVAVGLGDSPLALAVTAAKLGIPLAVWVGKDAPEASEIERGERRILATLASLDAGPVGDGVQAFRAAERIAAWANPD